MSFSLVSLVNFLRNTDNKHPIVHPGGWGMVCLIWVPGPGTHIRQSIPQTPGWAMGCPGPAMGCLLWVFQRKWSYAFSETKIIYFPMDPAGHDLYGFETTGNGSHHWCFIHCKFKDASPERRWLVADQSLSSFNGYMMQDASISESLPFRPFCL